MPYTHVQFIAYEIHTLDPFRSSARTDAPLADVLWRTRVLFDVMVFCYNQPTQVDNQDTTLKIFVAPEFYGRYYQGKSDGNGHNSIRDVQDAINALKVRCQKDPRFEHWLVIPGSYVAAEPVVGRTNQIFNFINVFMGNKSVERTIHKKEFSTIDKLEASFRAGRGKYQLHASQGRVGIKFSTIQVANLTIGLEVCLDHLLQRLRGYVQNNVPTIINVHVLSACGMPFERDSITTKQNGYFFRNDGHSYPSYWGSNDLSVQWANGVGMTMRDEEVTIIPNIHIFQQVLPTALQLNSSDPTSQVTIYPVHQII